MNKTVYTALLAFFLFPTALISQDIEDLILEKRQPTCSEIAQTSADLFAQNMAKLDLDSANLVLDYWESKCGLTEPVFRSKILVSILSSYGLEAYLNEDLFTYLENYQDRLDIDSTNFQGFIMDQSIFLFGYVAPDSYFDQILTIKFQELANRLIPATNEYFLAKFYAGDTQNLFKEINQRNFSGTEFSKLYWNQVENVQGTTEGHLAWLTGLWLPTGELETLGPHPDLGFLLGWKKKKWNYDFILSFKFLQAQNEYFARRKSTNTIEPTRHFFGGQIGFEVGRDILAHRSHELQLIAGIALDGFDALQEEEDQNLEAQSIITYNLNGGIGYRYYTNGNFYLGLRAKYNLVDYTINNVVDLTGNAITIQFVIGGVNNVFKSRRLKNLGVRHRR